MALYKIKIWLSRWTARIGPLSTMKYGGSTVSCRRTRRESKGTWLKNKKCTFFASKSIAARSRPWRGKSMSVRRSHWSWWKKWVRTNCNWKASGCSWKRSSQKSRLRRTTRILSQTKQRSSKFSNRLTEFIAQSRTCKIITKSNFWNVKTNYGCC